MASGTSTKSYFCERCKKTLRADEFYTSNNLEKYPNDGKFPLCKKCLTAHVDNWDPSTYLWILQEADVPYLPEEWHKLMVSYAKNPDKLTGMTILGRYLSKMKLKQHKNHRWADSEFLQNLNKSKIEQTMRDQGYSQQEIIKATESVSFEVPTEELAIPDLKNEPIVVGLPPKPVTDEPASANTFSAEEDAAILEQLSEDEQTYLRLKWGKMYRPEEWVKLEQLYCEMMESYDIQAAGDINTLKLACKCSLKANQLLDLGDVEGAQKVTKMYDNLMKSGKWTAAQNKANEDENVDSVGQLVAICEKEGFIPRYYVETPNDHVDRVIEDMQRYTQNLITNESGLSQIIETAFRQMNEEQERIRAASEKTEEDEEAELFNYEAPVVTTEDYQDFKDFENSLNEEELSYFEQIFGVIGDDN